MIIGWVQQLKTWDLQVMSESVVIFVCFMFSSLVPLLEQGKMHAERDTSFLLIDILAVRTWGYKEPLLMHMGGLEA